MSNNTPTFHPNYRKKLFKFKGLGQRQKNCPDIKVWKVFCKISRSATKHFAKISKSGKYSAKISRSAARQPVGNIQFYRHCHLLSLVITYEQFVYKNTFTNKLSVIICDNIFTSVVHVINSATIINVISIMSIIMRHHHHHHQYDHQASSGEYLGVGASERDSI